MLMKKDEIKQYIDLKTMSLVDAMKQIDSNSMGLIYVVNESEKLVGCLTDGDVRRWIIQNGSLEGTAYDAMNHKPKYVSFRNTGLAEKRMRDEGIYSIAVIDDEQNITDILFSEFYRKVENQHNNEALRDVPIIIMAGGKGTRLYPYTKILPKPLIPIQDVPILERILDRFYSFGAREFYLTLNYKKEMIKSYFSEIKVAYKLHYIEENRPLGTAGSIRLIGRKFCSPVIVSNCDILIQADYDNLMEHHKASGNAMTIVASLKNICIPYGVLHSQEQGIIISMEEKPELSYFINTGMYVINPEFLEWIPTDRVFHMTDLANMLVQEGEQVGMYPISENSFLDMGEFEEMRRMEERINGRPT